MCRPFKALGFQLFASFHGHCAVALHDPRRDFFVSVPGRILDHDAVWCGCGFFGSLADTVVIVKVEDVDVGAEILDVFQPRLRRPFRHVDDGFLAQFLSGPGDAAAVITIGSRKEGGLAEFLAEFIRGQDVIRQVRYVAVRFLGDVFGHGIGTAQDFKGV